MIFAGSFHRHLVVVFVAGLAGLGFATAQAAPAHNGYVQVADLFGPSDEEKAADAQREAAQDASVANLTQRVSDLEESLRRLTGQIEDANHRADVLQQRIEQMRKDFDYKICTLSAQKLAGATDSSDQSGLACSPSGSPAAGAAPAAPVMGEPSGQPSGVLGTLPAGTPLPSSGTGPAAPAQSGNQTQYNAAMTLLAKAQYDEASGAFRSFADTYPKDDRAPQAIHWIGSIAYMQQDFPGAARAFAEEIKKYPNSPSAADSMLKLGQSLIAMKQKKEGCTALEALPRTYPKAAKTVREAARKARDDARCR